MHRLPSSISVLRQPDPLLSLRELSIAIVELHLLFKREDLRHKVLARLFFCQRFTSSKGAKASLSSYYAVYSPQSMSYGYYWAKMMFVDGLRLSVIIKAKLSSIVIIDGDLAGCLRYLLLKLKKLGGPKSQLS